MSLFCRVVTFIDDWALSPPYGSCSMGFYRHAMSPKLTRSNRGEVPDKDADYSGVPFSSAACQP